MQPTSEPLTTAASTTQPPTTNTPHATLSPDEHSFGKQWKAEFDSVVVNAAYMGDTLYIALQSPVNLALAAVDLKDGEIRWTKNVAGGGGRWDGASNLGPTSVGVMTSFQAEDGGHLVLLDGRSGAEVWNVALNTYGYELEGEIADGIARFWPTEYEQMFVDLRSGQQLPDLPIDFFVEHRGAIQDGSTLRVDLDPMDSSTGGHAIDLGSEAQIVNVGMSDNTLLLLNSAGTLSGYVDGERSWSLELGDLEIQGFTKVGHLLVVLADSGESPVIVDDPHYYWIDDGTTNPLIGVPKDFVPEDIGLIADRPVLLGRIDANPYEDLPDEVNPGLALVVDQGEAATMSQFDLAPSTDVVVLGDNVLIGNFDFGEMTVYTLDGMERIRDVDAIGGFRIGPDWLLVMEADGRTVTLYR